MSHSVAQHLSVSAAAYDAEIRRFIPHYDVMLDEAVSAVREHAAADAHVLDLGAGTGALAERIARAMPAAHLTLVDADASMLAQAKERLAADAARVTLREGSFTDALPACDVAVAAFSLHHVHARDDKRALYRNIAASVRAGGLLVVVDAMTPDGGPLAEPLRRRWAAHLVGAGDSEAQAYARFAEWAREDRYYTVAEELDAIAAAGFSAGDVRWRVGPTAVLVAVK
jgi:tRNA (cmo5U34)-methyltransferase